MGIPIFHIDAFTNERFKGNPAGVCFLSKPAEPHWMQGIAAEMNLSETAFIDPAKDGYNLRWFTPAVEVALCGHATLATAHILWESGRLPDDTQARFHTRSGLLTASKKQGWIEMDFPARRAEPVAAPPELIEALGVTHRYIGRNEYDYLVEVESEETVRSLQPDYRLLKTLGVRGVMVTSRSATSQFDFVSRFFAPGAGVEEDPVTGSAHCCLGPYWQEHLNKDTFTAFQASHRGGIVKVRVVNDRVLLTGQAVTVIKGELV